MLAVSQSGDRIHPPLFSPVYRVAALHNFHVTLLRALDAGDTEWVDSLCRHRDEGWEKQCQSAS